MATGERFRDFKGRYQAKRALEIATAGGHTIVILCVVLRQNPGRVDTVDFLCLGTRHFPDMILMILRLLSLIPTTLRLRSDLALENLALRQQIAVLNR